MDCLVCGPGTLIELDTSVTLLQVILNFSWVLLIKLQATNFVYLVGHKMLIIPDLSQNAFSYTFSCGFYTSLTYDFNIIQALILRS